MLSLTQPQRHCSAGNLNPLDNRLTRAAALALIFNLDLSQSVVQTLLHSLLRVSRGIALR